jgi:hypothetical protein
MARVHPLPTRIELEADGDNNRPNPANTGTDDKDANDHENDAGNEKHCDNAGTTATIVTMLC